MNDWVFGKIEQYRIMITNPSLQKLHLTLGRSISSQFLWNYITAFKWQGLEFADVRWYVAGDPVKRIDWKTSAKKWWELYIKEFVEERQLKLWMVCDLSENISPWGESPKLQKAKKVMYALGYAAIRNGDRIGRIDGWATVKLWGKWETLFRIIWREEKSSMRKLLRHILRGKKKDTSSDKSTLEIKLKQIVQMKQTGTLVVIITDRIDINENIVKQVGQKNEILWVHIFSKQETLLESEDGYIQFEDRFIASDKWQVTGIQQSYTALVQEKLQETQRLVQSVWGRYVQIDTRDDVVRELMRVM